MEIAALVWQYDRLRPDAIEQKLITYSNGQVFDVPGRPQSPYFQDTVYTVSFLKGVASSFSPIFSLPEALWFSNLAEKPLIHIDAGDGSGWQLCSPGQTIQPHYSDAGLYDVQLRFTFAKGIVRYAHTPIQIEAPIVAERGWNIEPDESITITANQGYLGTSNSATVHVFYNCGNKKLFKPLIVFEGLEVVGAEERFNSWNNLRDGLSFPFLNNKTQSIRDFVEKEGYDLIYVDWAAGSGMDYIQRNAFLAESVIEWVNEKKAEAGSTEQNVVMGFSMGGLVAMYALRDMPGKGMDHDTRLFISYDAPLQGANIPLGTQMTIDYFPNFVYNSTGYDIATVPALEFAYEGVTSPAARQMLKYHLLSVDGTAEPINTEHVAFMAELNALSALSMRHVAISLGSDNGTPIQNNILEGASMFNVTADFNLCTHIWGILVCDGEFHMDITVRATGNNAVTTVFEANTYLDIDIPNQHFDFSSTTTCFTKPYDVASGGSSNVGVAPLGLLTTVIPSGTAIGGTGLTATHHCFIPTFSSLNAPEPANLLTGQSCGAASRCSSPTEPSLCSFSGALEINEEHITINERTALLIVEELVTLSASPYALPVSPAALTTYYNAGIAPQDAITDLVIASATGKLSINNTGKVGYATGSEPAAPSNLFKAYTRCGNITVEDAAQLVVGADNGTKDGVLFVTSGATVHIKSGGALRIMGPQSELRILPGARLILEPGAIVSLDNGGSKIRIEGQMIVNGDVKFSGLGYFDFAGGPSQLTMGAGYSNFNLKGFSKTNRFVFLSTPLAVPDNKRLNWWNGLLDVDKNTVGVGTNAGVTFSNMTIKGDGGVSATGLSAKYGGTQTFNRCDFEQLYGGINMENTQSLVVQNCNFTGVGAPIEGINNPYIKVSSTNFNNNYSKGIFWVQGGQALIEDSQFYGGNGAQALFISDVPLVLIDGCYVSGHQDPTIPSNALNGDFATATAAIYAENGIFVIRGTTIESNTVGISSLTFASQDMEAAGIFLIGSTILSNNMAGVFMRGDATKGTVLADCATFINNRQGIVGNDIALMLDSQNTSIWSEDTDTPNAFVRDNDPKGGNGSTMDHIRVCYGLKSVASSIPMTNNWWATSTSTGNTVFDLAPEPFISLLTVNCDGVAAVGAITPRPATVPDFCPVEGKPGNFGNNEPQTDCTTGINALTGEERSVNWQWHEAYYQLKTEPLSELGVDLFRPVADLWQPDLSSYSDNCQQYIATARAIVDGVDDAMGMDTGARPSERKNAALWKSSISLKVAPNPAQESVNIILPFNTVHLTVMDMNGRVVLQQNQPDKWINASVRDWSGGLYVVRAGLLDGSFVTTKLAVVK